VSDRYAALHQAADNGHLDCVQVLIDCGADVNIKSLDNKQTPLYIAAGRGHIFIVALLIENRANMNTECDQTFDDDGDIGVAIEVAAYYNHKDVVKMFLDKGAIEVDYVMASAAKNGSLDCIDFLLDVGFDVNSPTCNSPLNRTCYCNHVACAKYLISRGANVNCDGYEGTLLIDMSYFLIDNSDTVEIFRLLLDNNVDIDDDIDKYGIEFRPMILAEIKDRQTRATFDAFIVHHIGYPQYRDMIYSICYPDGNTLVAAPPVGWSRADAVRNKYYYDETFFYLYLHVSKIVTNSTSDNFSNIIALAVNSNDTSTLMMVLVDRLQLYIKPPAL